MTTATHPREQTEAIFKELRFVKVDGGHPDVDKMVNAYMQRFGLGPRNRAMERAYVWRGARYHGHIVAVFGERLDGRTLELTDAYHDGSDAGKVAWVYMAADYLRKARSGQLDALVHQILYANTEYWQTVIKETDDLPWSLTFVHRPFPKELA